MRQMEMRPTATRVLTKPGLCVRHTTDCAKSVCADRRPNPFGKADSYWLKEPCIKYYHGRHCMRGRTAYVGSPSAHGYTWCPGCFMGEYNIPDNNGKDRNVKVDHVINGSRCTPLANMIVIRLR